MTYSQILEREERPTIPIPAPEPTVMELVERLNHTEHQIALLMQRRERTLQKLKEKGYSR